MTTTDFEKIKTQDVSAEHARHLDDCPLCWLSMEVQFADDEYREDWPGELIGGVALMLAPDQMNHITGSWPDPKGSWLYVNAVIDLASYTPWTAHESLHIVQQGADQLRDAANLIAASRAGGWRADIRQRWNEDGEFVLRPRVAQYFARFSPDAGYVQPTNTVVEHDPDDGYTCEHAAAIAASPSCGPLRSLMRSHGIDAETFTVALGLASPSDRPAPRHLAAAPDVYRVLNAVYLAAAPDVYRVLNAVYQDPF